MEGQDVVTSDDHKLGTVIAERDDCVVIETGHVFKTKHAIPKSFLHEHEGVLRATVTKDVVDDSPKVDLENWDCEVVRLHYGIDGPFETDPPEDAAHAAQPAPDADIVDAGPVIRDRQATAADPAGVTANLSDRNRTGP